MTEEEIKFLLSEENNEVLNAHKEIISMQKDKSSLILFGKPWMDDNLVGGVNNKILFYGSRPGGGKTHHCSETINALLDRKLNPMPIRVARFNLEMPTQTLLLQQISRTLKKTPKEILEKPYSEEERPIVTSIVNAFTDKRIKNISKVLQAQDFKKFVLAFTSEINKEDKLKNKNRLKQLIEKEPNKEVEIRKSFVEELTKKVCLIDHLMIYRNKEEIDNLLLVCNELKMQDRNLSFIIYFQLRRDVEDLWRETKDKKVNPKNMLPNSTFIYMSDVLQQIADIVVGMTIPQIYDLDEFVAVNKERNEHLKEHFTEDLADNRFCRLKGRNRIYYNYMKIRLLNSFDDPRVFCDILNPDYEEKASKLMEGNKLVFNSSAFSTPVFNTPTFEPSIPSPNFSVEDAFGTGDKEKIDGEPF